MVHNLPENFNISDFDVFHSALLSNQKRLSSRLIEWKNVWKPKLNKVVLPPPLLTFHLWLGKLSKSSGWRNFSGSHLHSRETVGENQGVKEEEVEGGGRGHEAF